jgi:hypothetical protein
LQNAASGSARALKKPILFGIYLGKYRDDQELITSITTSIQVQPNFKMAGFTIGCKIWFFFQPPILMRLPVGTQETLHGGIDPDVWLLFSHVHQKSSSSLVVVVAKMCLVFSPLVAVEP